MSVTATCFYRRNPRWRITSHPEPDFGFSQASIVDDFSTVWNSAGAVDCTALHGVQNPFFAGTRGELFWKRYVLDKWKFDSDLTPNSVRLTWQKLEAETPDNHGLHSSTGCIQSKEHVPFFSWIGGMVAKALPQCRMWSERRHRKGPRSSSYKLSTSGIRNWSIPVGVLEGAKIRCWIPEKFALFLPKVLGRSTSGGDLHEAAHQSWNVPQSQLIRTSGGTSSAKYV